MARQPEGAVGRAGVSALASRAGAGVVPVVPGLQQRSSRAAAQWHRYQRAVRVSGRLRDMDQAVDEAQVQRLTALVVGTAPAYKPKPRRLWAVGLGASEAEQSLMLTSLIGNGTGTGNLSSTSPAAGAAAATAAVSTPSAGKAKDKVKDKKFKEKEKDKDKEKDKKSEAAGSGKDATDSPHAKVVLGNPLEWSVQTWNPSKMNLGTVRSGTRFFVMKPFTTADVFYSLRYGMYSSSKADRLQKAYNGAKAVGERLFILYSVSGSGRFCGVAEMTSPVHYNRILDLQQYPGTQRWRNNFSVRWIFVKDVSNAHLKHIRVEHDRLLTTSFDATQIPYPAGLGVLKVFCQHRAQFSLMDEYISAASSAGLPRIKGGKPDQVADTMLSAEELERVDAAASGSGGIASGGNASASSATSGPGKKAKRPSPVETNSSAHEGSGKTPSSSASHTPAASASSSKSSRAQGSAGGPSRSWYHHGDAGTPKIGASTPSSGVYPLRRPPSPRSAASPSQAAETRSRLSGAQGEAIWTINLPK